MIVRQKNRETGRGKQRVTARFIVCKEAYVPAKRTSRTTSGQSRERHVLEKD